MIGCCDLCERSEYLHMFSPQNGNAFYLCMDCWNYLKNEDQAKEKWNSEADEYNQWCSLGGDEKDELIAKVKMKSRAKRKKTK